MALGPEGGLRARSTAPASTGHTVRGARARRTRGRVAAGAQRSGQQRAHCTAADDVIRHSAQMSYIYIGELAYLLARRRRRDEFAVPLDCSAPENQSPAPSLASAQPQNAGFCAWRRLQGRESSQATTNRPIMGRQIYFAPIDLVEDRARTRVVGVAVMTAVYKPRPKTGSRRMLVLLVLPRGIGLHCKAGRGTIRSVAWHRAKGPSDPYPYLLLASKWRPSADSILMCM